MFFNLVLIFTTITETRKMVSSYRVMSVGYRRVQYVLTSGFSSAIQLASFPKALRTGDTDKPGMYENAFLRV